MERKFSMEIKIISLIWYKSFILYFKLQSNSNKNYLQIRRIKTNKNPKNYYNLSQRINNLKKKKAKSKRRKNLQAKSFQNLNPKDIQY